MSVNIIVVWIGVGAVTGLLASLLLSHAPAGVMGGIIIGILGAVVFGLVFGMLDLPISAGIVTNVGVAFTGSVILLGIAQKVL
jgi:uncharacterized membrane protein YeaQ/YmgE (transglycosylase-associated protein family)